MKVELQVRDSARRPTSCELEVETFPFRTRVLRALSRLGSCWALAVPCVLIPLLHFVLVPGLVLVGPVLAALAFRATVVVKTAQVPCPKCTKETALEPNTTGWPATFRCTHCSTTFFASQAS
jgi:hypothetical protein